MKKINRFILVKNSCGNYCGDFPTIDEVAYHMYWSDMSTADYHVVDLKGSAKIPRDELADAIRNSYKYY